MTTLSGSAFAIFRHFVEEYTVPECNIRQHFEDLRSGNSSISSGEQFLIVLLNIPMSTTDHTLTLSRQQALSPCKFTSDTGVVYHQQVQGHIFTTRVVEGRHLAWTGRSSSHRMDCLFIPCIWGTQPETHALTPPIYNCPVCQVEASHLSPRVHAFPGDSSCIIYGSPRWGCVRKIPIGAESQKALSLG